MKLTKFVLGVVLTLNFTACGTLMHPERKGQTQGPVDVGIAVLDGLGLLLGIIPGVIAYAIDFSNGTIYLPSGKGKNKALRMIRFDPSGDRVAQIERILSGEAGVPVRLANSTLSRVDSADQLPVLLAQR